MYVAYSRTLKSNTHSNIFPETRATCPDWLLSDQRITCENVSHRVRFVCRQTPTMSHVEQNTCGNIYQNIMGASSPRPEYRGEIWAQTEGAARAWQTHIMNGRARPRWHLFHFLLSRDRSRAPWRSLPVHRSDNLEERWTAFPLSLDTPASHPTPAMFTVWDGKMDSLFYFPFHFFSSGWGEFSFVVYPGGEGFCIFH